MATGHRHALLRGEHRHRQKLDDRRCVAMGLINIGLIATEQGEYQLVQPYHEEALAIRRELGYKICISRALSGLGLAARKSDDSAKAAALTRESLAIECELGDKQGIAERLQELASALSRQSEVDTTLTVRLLGAAAAFREAIGAPPTPTERSEYESAVATVRTVLGASLWLRV